MTEPTPKRPRGPRASDTIRIADPEALQSVLQHLEGRVHIAATGVAKVALDWNENAAQPLRDMLVDAARKLVGAQDAWQQAKGES